MEIDPIGGSLLALVREHANFLQSGEEGYIQEILDERQADVKRDDTDQVGVSIILCNPDFLRRCISNPNLGVDGTFSLAHCSDPNIKCEIVCVVCKDSRSGRAFCVCTQISSRKTVGSRMCLITWLIAKLKEYGLPDPLLEQPSKMLTVCMDYENGFAISLRSPLREVYRVGAEEGVWKGYVAVVAFGCGVHAKRVILEKISNDVRTPIYVRALGTRKAEDLDEAIKCMQYMSYMSRKWACFAEWLRNNSVAFIIWFTQVYKKNWNYN